MPIAPRLVDLFASLLSPPTCAACDAPVRRARAFCPVCAATVLPPPATDVVAVGAYGGALSTAVSRLKFASRPDVALALGDLLASTLDALSADAIVPLPLGPERLRDRGYNQSALLAQRLSRAHAVPLRTGWLRRVRESAPQTQLDRDARRANVVGLFAATRRLDGVRVVLVDDVVTTGATMEAAVAALEQAGADVVIRAAVAVAELASLPPRDS